MSPVSPGDTSVVRPPVNGTTQGVPTSIASATLLEHIGFQQKACQGLSIHWTCERDALLQSERP